MVNETYIYKTINNKNYTQTKYLFSQLLKHVFNKLEKDNLLGTSKKFTVITEAIFFMLGKQTLYETWHDYSTILETAYKQTGEFPKYLYNNFEKLKHFHNTCPIVVEHSNERTLIKIVEKLLKKCTDLDNKQDSSNMDVDDLGERVDIISQKIGVPMVKYGILQNTPTVEDVNGPFFVTNVSKFVNQLEVDFETIKRIAGTIPINEGGTVSGLLESCEKFFLKMLLEFGVTNFNTFVNILNDIMREVQSSSLMSVFESVKELNKQNDLLEIALNLRPEMDCEIGSVTLQQFQIYNIKYIVTNELDKYSFYIDALYTFARCYVMSLNKNFYSSSEEFEQCKNDQKYFMSKLNSYIEFFGQGSVMTELVQFKNQVLTYVNSPTEKECIQTFQLLIEIYKVTSLNSIYTETKILFNYFGSYEGIETINYGLEVFLTKYDKGNNLGHALATVEQILVCISKDNSVNHCLSVLQNLLKRCGNVNTVEEIDNAIGQVEEVYENRLKDEQFSINNLSLVLETFINQVSTEKFKYILGDTIDQKLNFVHEQLTEPLSKLCPNIKYSDLIGFLRNLVDDKEAILNKSTLSNIVENYKNFTKIKQEIIELSTRLIEQTEKLKNCTKSLDDYKIKFDTSNKANVDYANKIEQLAKERGENTVDKKKYNTVLQELEKLKQENDVLLKSYKLIEQQHFELQAKSGPKIGVVRPGKRRKLSEPSQGDRHDDDYEDSSASKME